MSGRADLRSVQDRGGRQFLQRISTSREQSDLGAAIRKGDCRRKADPRRSTRDYENAIFDLHRFMLLDLSLGAPNRRRAHGVAFEIAHVFEIGDQSRPGRLPSELFPGNRT